VIALLVIAWLAAGCSAVQVIDRDGRAPGYLELEVQPPQTEIHVDERFRGTAAQWSDSVMTLPAGHHRVRLALDGHYTRRFDVRIRRGMVRELEVVMVEKVGGRAWLDTPRARRRQVCAVVGRGARRRVARRTYDDFRESAKHVGACPVGRTRYDDFRESALPGSTTSASPRYPDLRLPRVRATRIYDSPRLCLLTRTRRRASGAKRRMITRLD
jgi:hypothetical protein